MARPGRLRIFVPHASDTFTNYLPHGDGLVAFEVASRLAERGHEVHVMAPGMDVVGTLPATLRLEPPRGAVANGLRGRFAYMAAVRSTYARLRRDGPFDIIHQLNPVFAGISLALADRGVPTVLGAFVSPWPRDADTADIMGVATGLPFAVAVKHAISTIQQCLAAALIVTTPAAVGRIAPLLRSRRRIFTIPHGIDPAQFPPAPFVPATPTILFLGGTERRKGIYVLLEAFAAVRRAVPGVRLVIAGAGGREGEVAAAIAALADRDGIDMVGAVARSEVPSLMREASVFVAPSFGEPFGMSLLEAMASAKPVVVTDAGGPAHIVDSRGGYRVPVGDAAALANALVDVLRSPQSAEAMGRHNREKIESTYAWDRVIDRIEDVYARVLADRRR